MRKLNITIRLGAAAMMLLAVSCNPSEREHRDKAVENTDSTVDITTRAKVSTADIDMDGAEKAFIISTYAQSLYTIELANIAAKSQNAQVRSLTKKITPGYQQLVSNMEQISKGKGLLLERSISSAQQKELDALRELSSPTLDQQVLQKLQSLQATFTTLFKEAQHLKNSDLKNYAENGLTIIHQQQSETTKLVNLVNETGSQSTRPGEVATP